MNERMIKNIKGLYSGGTHVRLIHMDDWQAPPSGTEGTVACVDDIGQIHVKWDKGSELALLYGEDEFEKIGA